MTIKIKVGDTLYEIDIDNNMIDVYHYTNRPFGNGFGTNFKLTGTKTVEICEYNNTWACRGMGMNDSRTTKIVNAELYNKIKEIIQEIKKIEETEKDTDIKFEKEAEILKDIDAHTHEDYIDDC
jgi:hypothetical protein